MPTSLLMTFQNSQPEDSDGVEARVDALEQTLELTYRPIADFCTPERILAIEQATFRAHMRIATLEARITELEITAAEAHNMGRAVIDSRIWKTLVAVSDVLLRLTGRRSHPGA